MYICTFISVYIFELTKESERSRNWMKVQYLILILILTFSSVYKSVEIIMELVRTMHVVATGNFVIKKNEDNENSVKVYMGTIVTIKTFQASIQINTQEYRAKYVYNINNSPTSEVENLRETITNNLLDITDHDKKRIDMGNKIYCVLCIYYMLHINKLIQ